MVSDTLWSDVSEFQVGVTNAYPHRFLCLRSHDGGHNDDKFMHNITWANQAVESGRLWGYMVYYFYRPGFDGAASLRARVGPHPNPKMIAMIDVESANGQVHGNQSDQVNREFRELAAWLGDRRRVVGYGNVSDLNALWPVKPDGIRLIIAAYGSNPGYPGKFAHQFTDHANTPPFGPSDLNSADGMTPHELQVMFGLTTSPPPEPPRADDHIPGANGGQRVGTGHRWSANGSRSLIEVAAFRHAQVIDLIEVTSENLNERNARAFNKYVLGGIQFPMPEGLIFYTRHGG